VDGFVNFYFHWLRAFGGWAVILFLTAVPVIWLFNDSDLRLLPARWWRLSTALTFFLFLPTFLLGVRAALNPTLRVNPLRPDAQFSAALGLVMMVLIWVIVGSYIWIYWGMMGSEGGHGVYRHGEHDPYLTQAQIDALKEGGKPVYQANLFPQRAYAEGILFDEMTHTPYRLMKGQTSLGRSKRNDIVLAQDRAISRRQGMIWETSGTYVLHNYSAHHPIQYNGQLMVQRQTYILKHGDRLHVGKVHLIFSAHGASLA